MQALSQSVNLDNGDVVILSTDPVTPGGFMTLQIQHGNVTLSSPLTQFKWAELLQKGGDVAQTARIA